MNSGSPTLASHPNHLGADNLAKIKALGVRHLSLGVEALFDRHLQFLRRPYTAARSPPVSSA